MIRLSTFNSDRHELIAPDRIARVFDSDHGTVVYVDGYAYAINVQESVADVARLRAAWEMRYGFAQVAENNALPIYVGMCEDGIHMSCCKHTRNLVDNEQRMSDPTLS